MNFFHVNIKFYIIFYLTTTIFQYHSRISELFHTILTFGLWSTVPVFVASDHRFISMRAYGRARPRAPARFISVKEDDHCFYFEISSNGTLISPPELSHGCVTQSCSQAELSDSLQTSSSKRHCAYEFVGFFDPTKVKAPIVPSMRFPVPGYSIQDLLIGSIPKWTTNCWINPYVLGRCFKFERIFEYLSLTFSVVKWPDNQPDGDDRRIVVAAVMVPWFWDSAGVEVGR
jgi:hypothetical protein